MQYRVDIIESERGWGQRIDETMYFDTKEDALKFVERYNTRNTTSSVPDWYMYAEKPVLVQRQVR